MNRLLSMFALLAGPPDDVPHAQVVTVADGDRYEVTAAAQGRL